ncbi:hypothetical protein KC887_03680 [Candidatus Kaiserbacteria bacterium]|nr:hypothetical protein [Candidatus Kaiserbacteria bacterium]
MQQRRLTLFFISALAFLGAHITANKLALYWYFWWADIIMHFWGGLLIGLGVHILASLPSLPIRATLPWLLTILFVVTFSWEGFERYFGLYNPDGYVLDTIMDIALGFTGGLLAHTVLTKS